MLFAIRHFLIRRKPVAADCTCTAANAFSSNDSSCAFVNNMYLLPALIMHRLGCCVPSVHDGEHNRLLRFHTSTTIHFIVGRKSL